MSDKNEPTISSIDSFLDRQINKRIDGYIDLYAKKDDGTIDQALATRIRWEVGRRGETGKQLDIYEPLRWTGIRAVLGVMGAVAAKAITNRITGKEKKLGTGIEIGLLISTAISSIIDLTRLFPRWLAGLEGGKNTALKLHRQNAASPEVKAYVSEVPKEIETTEPPLSEPPAHQQKILKERAKREDTKVQSSL